MNIPYDASWIGILKEHIRAALERSSSRGVVLGISGGLDSAVAMALAVESVGSESVLGVLMPSASTPTEDMVHARENAVELGVETMEFSIVGILQSFRDAGVSWEGMAGANLHSRTRMCILYNLANSRSLLVVGTSNKTELMLGYFTKYGDGGSDICPLGDLYKTQVRRLAEDLGIPEPILKKTPSAGLPGVGSDEEEIGYPYETLDMVLHALEFGWVVARICDETGVALKDVENIIGLVRRSRHKRNLGLVPKIGVRTVGLDLREDTSW